MSLLFYKKGDFNMKKIKRGDLCIVRGKENIKRRVIAAMGNTVLLCGYYEYIPITEVIKVEE